MKIKILIILSILSIGLDLTSQESHHKWQKLGGKWKIINSQAVEERAWSIIWDYYTLSNYNSIISLQPYADYSSIEINSKLFDREKTPTEFMISFNVTSETLGWYYHMYAFRITGNFWGMNKVSFIYSDRADKTKPFNTKNNTFIKELATTDFKIKYDKSYNYRVAFEGENVSLYINDEKILSAPFPEKNHHGQIAISSKNTKISIDKVTVKKNAQIIFEDDFNKDTIYVKVLKVIRVPSDYGNNIEDTKP